MVKTLIVVMGHCCFQFRGISSACAQLSTANVSTSRRQVAIAGSRTSVLKRKKGIRPTLSFSFLESAFDC